MKNIFALNAVQKQKQTQRRNDPECKQDNIQQFKDYFRNTDTKIRREEEEKKSSDKERRRDRMSN
jgi:hypothetical protein